MLRSDGIDLGFISSVLGIIVIDQVLSGDSAVVIALAARRREDRVTLPTILAR